MAFICSMLRLEAVASTDYDSTIRISRETQRSFGTNTMLINRLFREVYSFKAHVQVIIYRINDTSIQLTSV